MRDRTWHGAAAGSDPPPWPPWRGPHARWWEPHSHDKSGGRWPDWWARRQRHDWLSRGATGRVAVITALIQVFANRAAADDEPLARPLDLLAYCLLLAGPVALLWRRRAPVAPLAVSLAAALGYALAGYPTGAFFVAAVVAVFTAVRAGRRGWAWGLSAGAYAAYLLLGVVLADPLGVPEHSRPGARQALTVAVWVVVALLLAEAHRVRSDHLEHLASIRAEQARARSEQARAREEQERRQASEERLRIARELHDVLGHHLSLINVQAGVGLHLMDSRPEQAREALAAIKSASAEALREVRSVLGVLRPEEEAAPRNPAPGLDRLADLTADAGLPVRSEVVGTPVALPPEVDRAAYRIVQEALTNVRRHAGPGATASISLDYAGDGLTLRVADDGVGSAPEQTAGGNGIAGMRARAEALGGSLRAGPGPDRGFEVVAVLPGGGRRGAVSVGGRE